MPHLNSRGRKQLQFSLGGSKQQQISNLTGSGTGLALATNPFHCLSTYHDDSSAEEDEDLARKIAECDLKQVIPWNDLLEGGTLFCDNRLDLLTSEVDGSTSTGEYTDKELLCGLGNLERNILHDDEPLIRMDHIGRNLIYVKDSNNDDLSELFRKHHRKDGSYDYVFSEEPNPWSCTYSVDVLPETQSPSLSCNLDKDQQDNRSICTEADNIEPRIPVASEGTEIHINNEDLDLDKEIMNMGGTISEDADIYGDQITFNRSPAEFWVGRDFGGYLVSNPEDIDKINRNLAMHRIKAYELSKGIHLHDRKLDYNPDTFNERDYFVDYEDEFEWFFHPEYCNLAGLDDYQPVVDPEMSCAPG